MKIAFISNGYESLGLEYISYVLKKNGFKVELFIDPMLFNEPNFWKAKKLNYFFDYTKILMKEIENFKPNIVAFSVLTDTYQWALKRAYEIKKINPNIIIFFGGIHPTLLPDIVIKNRQVDCVFIGEAEEVIIRVIEILETKKYKELDGVIFKKNNKIYYSSLYKKPLTVNLKGLFPDKSLFYLKYPFSKNYYLTSLSRGCIFECSYCINDFYRKNTSFHFRVRDIDEVIYELELAKKIYSCKFVHFVDEVFNFNKNFLFTFLKKYREKVNLPFSCYIHPSLIDDETIKLLANSNCRRVQFGMQNFNEEVRKKILKRNVPNNKIIEVIKKFKSYRIFTICDHIIGVPGDDEKDFENICKLYINEDKADLNEVFFLRYYPKSSITEYAYKKKIITNVDLFKINNGLIEYGITDSKNSDFLKKSQTLFLISILPKKLLITLLRFNLINRLPIINNIFARIILRIIKIQFRNVPDFYTIQFIKKYIYFVFKKLFFIYAFNYFQKKPNKS